MLYVGVALLGSLFTPPLLMLLVVPVLVFGVAAMLIGTFRYCQQSWPSRRLVSSTALVTAGAVPFAHGVDVLGAAGQVVGVLVFALATVVATSRLNALTAAELRAASSPHGSDGHIPDAGPGDGQSLQELLRSVPLEVLFTEWQAAQERTAGRSCSRHAAPGVQARALLLDELERRDPVGFSSWLEEGAVAPPEHHIHDDHGLAA